MGLDKMGKEGYRAMTANGDYKLTRENYDFVFANFLLGKDIYGPGKYIFGVFDNREIDETFSSQTGLSRHQRVKIHEHFLAHIFGNHRCAGTAGDNGKEVVPSTDDTTSVALDEFP